MKLKKLVSIWNKWFTCFRICFQVASIGGSILWGCFQWCCHLQILAMRFVAKLTMLPSSLLFLLFFLFFKFTFLSFFKTFSSYVCCSLWLQHFLWQFVLCLCSEAMMDKTWNCSLFSTLCWSVWVSVTALWHMCRIVACYCRS